MNVDVDFIDVEMAHFLNLAFECPTQAEKYMNQAIGMAIAFADLANENGSYALAHQIIDLWNNEWCSKFTDIIEKI